MIEVYRIASLLPEHQHYWKVVWEHFFLEIIE